MKRGSVLVLSAGLAWGGIGGGVGDVKVGLGKNPPGNVQQMAATDPGGNIRLRVPEAGRYVIHFEQPVAFPFWVHVNGEVRGMGQPPAGGRPLAMGMMFPAGGPTGARVAMPGIPFHAQTRVYREEIEFNGPAEMILRLTEGPPMQPQPCPPGMRPPCPAVSTNTGPAPRPGPRAAGPAPVVTYRPRRVPPNLEHGRSYQAVDPRTRRVVSRFRLNPDGTVSAQMVAKEGGDDNGGGGCTVCKAPGDCFKFEPLPPDITVLPHMEAEDPILVYKGQSAGGPGGGSGGGSGGNVTGDCGGAIVGVAWPSVTTRSGQATNN